MSTIGYSFSNIVFKGRALPDGEDLICWECGEAMVYRLGVSRMHKNQPCYCCENFQCSEGTTEWTPDGARMRQAANKAG